MQTGGGRDGAGGPRGGLHRRVRQDVGHRPHRHTRGDGAGPRHHRQGGRARHAQRALLRARRRQPRLREGNYTPHLTPFTIRCAMRVRVRA